LLLPLSPTSSVRLRPPPSPSLFPYTTLFRSISQSQPSVPVQAATPPHVGVRDEDGADEQEHLDKPEQTEQIEGHGPRVEEDDLEDRKSTRLNSSHVKISYAVFCLKKKKQIKL